VAGWLYWIIDGCIPPVEAGIDIFLDKLKDEFMLVRLEEGGEATAAYGGYNRTVRDNTRLEDFRPSDAGNMVLDRGVSQIDAPVRPMVFVARITLTAPFMPDNRQSNQSSKRARSHHVYFLAHHLRLARARPLPHILFERRTAPFDAANVTAKGYQDEAEEAGEAGFFWETQAFGGIVEMWCDPARAKDGSDQPGIPYLFADMNESSLTQVSATYIRDFVASTAGMVAPKSFPWMILINGVYGRDNLSHLPSHSTILQPFPDKSTTANSGWKHSHG
jgi:hypothetical protein